MLKSQIIMKFVLGKKVEMSQRFRQNGEVVPVTLVSVPKNIVTDVRKRDRDGYSALQIGAFEAKNLSKSERGHLKDLPLVRHLCEVRVPDSSPWKRGDELGVLQFASGDIVKVIGTSKGKGFQGVVKRHHFRGHPSTHGHKDQERMPGAIGAGGLQHVRKGTRMAGRMGAERVTVKNLEVVEVDGEKGILAICGAVPGARGSTLLILGE